jgi:hypothetical protein
MDTLIDIYDLLKLNQEDTNNLSRLIMSNKIETLIIIFKTLQKRIHC